MKQIETLPRPDLIRSKLKAMSRSTGSLDQSHLVALAFKSGRGLYILVTVQEAVDLFTRLVRLRKIKGCTSARLLASNVAFFRASAAFVLWPVGPVLPVVAPAQSFTQVNRIFDAGSCKRWLVRSRLDGCHLVTGALNTGSSLNGLVSKQEALDGFSGFARVSRFKSSAPESCKRSN